LNLREGKYIPANHDLNVSYPTQYENS
jgi:hypothetical protein